MRHLCHIFSNLTVGTTHFLCSSKHQTLHLLHFLKLLLTHWDVVHRLSGFNASSWAWTQVGSSWLSYSCLRYWVEHLCLQLVSLLPLCRIRFTCLWNRHQLFLSFCLLWLGQRFNKLFFIVVRSCFLFHFLLLHYDFFSFETFIIFLLLYHHGFFQLTLLNSKLLILVNVIAIGWW